MTEFGHARARSRRKFEGLAVERADSAPAGGVFVGDDSVGDAGVGEGHVHGAVTEERGDRSSRMPRLMAWVARVAQLVGCT